MMNHYDHALAQLYQSQTRFRHCKANYDRLNQIKLEKKEELEDLLEYSKNVLGKELSKYHESRVNTSKRGGGGALAVKNHKATKDLVESAIKSSGFQKITTKCDRIQRGWYRKNDSTAHPEICIHFRARTQRGSIVNVIVQTQKESGGAFSKSKYYIDIMTKIDEYFVFFFETTLNTVKTGVNGYFNVSGDHSNIAYFNDLQSFKNHISLL